MILITGGRGYLGGRLAQYFIQHQSMPVILATRRVDQALAHNLQGCRIVDLDLFNKNRLLEICEGVHTVIHLAAMNAQACALSPEQAPIVNGIGTLNLLNAANAAAVKRFIYFSTAHVYGAPLEGDIDETRVPQPLHPYAISHRLAEDYVHQVCSQSEMSGTILRLSNAVGAPIEKEVDCWMLVVNDLARQIILTREMRFRSSGTIQRDFISIRDLCDAVLSIVSSRADRFKGIYNLGAGTINLSDLASLIRSRAEHLFDYSPEISFAGEGGDSHTGLSFSVNKLKQSGIVIGDHMQEEIDGLLVATKKWF